MNTEDIEQLFLSKIQPYEERIQRLEEAEKAKGLEIVTLKHAIQNLHRIIEVLKNQVKVNEATGGKNGTKTVTHQERKITKANGLSSGQVY